MDTSDTPEQIEKRRLKLQQLDAAQAEQQALKERRRQQQQWVNAYLSMPLVYSQAVKAVYQPVLKHWPDVQASCGSTGEC
jgi:type II secretory pathway pseudopilin PulG